jgi:hypothetical protein
MSTATPETSAATSGSDVPGHRLQELQSRAALDAENIHLLRQQIVHLDAALKLEQARGEKHAETLMHIARTCDERASELNAQHAAALHSKDMTIAKMQDAVAAKDATIVQMEASHARAISKLESAFAKLEAETAVLKGSHAAAIKRLESEALVKLTDIDTAVTARRALEIYRIENFHKSRPHEQICSVSRGE